MRPCGRVRGGYPQALVGGIPERRRLAAAPGRVGDGRVLQGLCGIWLCWFLRSQVPTGVEPAPLRFPKGQDLVNLGWWAFGFPDGDAIGDSADGQVGASLSYGWVRLDTRSRYLIRPGFSGGGPMVTQITRL